MADFPTNPYLGETYTDSIGVVWTWDSFSWRTDGFGSGFGSANVWVDITPPPPGTSNSLWWDANSGYLKVYYENGGSSTWVDAIPTQVGPQGVDGGYVAQGITGTQGAFGVQGTTGAQGLNGTYAAQGIQGTTGASGPINASTYASGTYYPVMVAGSGSNYTPYIHTTLNYNLGTLTATAFASTSDARLKNVIGHIDDATSIVNQLNGIKFTWNNLGADLGYQSIHANGIEIGVLAQDVQTVLPEAVHLDKDGYLKVSYDRIIPVLIEAIKELNLNSSKQDRRIEELESLFRDKLGVLNKG